MINKTRHRHATKNTSHLGELHAQHANTGHLNGSPNHHHKNKDPHPNRAQGKGAQGKGTQGKGKD